MSKSKNFVAVIKEPANRLAIQLEFYEKPRGDLSGDPIMIWLNPGTSMEKAEILKRMLNELGVEIQGT